MRLGNGAINYIASFSRLPCSETQALKLYRRGEPGIFSLMSTVNGRERLNYMGTYPKAQNTKMSKRTCSGQPTTPVYLLGGEYHTH